MEQGTAGEIETAAAREPPRETRWPPLSGEPAAMLRRRGFAAMPSEPDLPFAPAGLEGPRAEALIENLHRYGFRLFLRGAIQARGAFRPEQATRYLEPEHARGHAETLVSLGIAERDGALRYRLVRQARSFGGTLEWYVARMLETRSGFETAIGLKLRAPWVGGDLDVLAVAEGRLVYAELKSGPPKHLSSSEVDAFLARVRCLRPHVSLFVVDTSLRLQDRVLPMLGDGLRRGRPARPEPQALGAGVWSLTPHLYVVSARSSLINNLERAIAAGLCALAPEPP